MRQSKFEVNILYQDDKTGNALNYLPGTPLSDQVLLQALGLDQLNSQLDRVPDGLFDFVDGITVMADKGTHNLSGEGAFREAPAEVFN